MIKPDKIQLHCTICDPPDWILYDTQEVEILLDLKNDDYVFYATCSECGGSIVNTRRAF
jgi:hypothetical protein